MPQADYAKGAPLTAPHNIPPDAPVNPAFTSGQNPHQQFPFAELHERTDPNNTAGEPEGVNPDTP